MRPNAGAICFVKFKGNLTSTELGDELAKAGIGMKPAYCFTGNVITEENDYFRIGLGEEIMPTALGALRVFMQGYKTSEQTKSNRK